jgi:8-oxo-dGTP pyrophosphatase MutT (NUDIX family)
MRVVLVTSRERRRWIIPKGWPIKGLKNPEVAETEAMEEAGVVGRISKKPIGRFIYDKQFPKKTVTVTVDVYGLEVLKELDEWQEKGQRDVQWFEVEEAARLADDRSVGELILHFAASFAKPDTIAAQETA